MIEAALGYYINPLITVALGVWVLGEHLRRLQLVALGFGAAAVAVLTAAYGRVPWIALVLACSFAGYGFLKKAVGVEATTSLAVETAVLLPAALVGMAVLQAKGDAAFLDGTVGPRCPPGEPGRRHRGAAAPLRDGGQPHPAVAPRPAPVPHADAAAPVRRHRLPRVDARRERLVGFVLVWVALVLLATDALRTAAPPRAEPVPVVEPA